MVTSAIKGVTNDLIQISSSIDKAVEIVSDIYDRHIKLLGKVTDGKEFEKAFRDISKLADELFRVAWSIRVLGEVTPRTRDYILSFGERMAVIALSAVLRANGIDASGIVDPPFITDSNFGDANIIPDASEARMKNLISDVKSNVVVFPGFIGTTKDGKTTTLGRGGSDYSATSIAKVLGINKVKLVTEVPGIMTGDPRKFNNAKSIPRLSLEEAIELAQLGAKRLHPRTFDPMFHSDITVEVESLYESGSTVINGECTNEDAVKGIAMLDQLKMVSVESTKIVGKVGSASAIMTEARDVGVNIIAISQPASETTINLVVDEKSVPSLIDRLSQLKGNLIKNVRLEDVSAISVVGCGMRKTEISSKLLGIASSYDPIMISRGLSRVSTTFIVNSGNAEVLGRELHNEVLKWTK
ncbi:putative aspartokinase [Sulfuracidifex tepidarius]|uniref:Aspartokinase n=1 Tax=Sulfuracidifex tepidarius TaxID=1294262 RepID=A0A510DV19_9CREN|nr:putative aspartokinase [Sulfuracidifex tepidarius]BBG26583.1 putative aspartokinase [Sulfuracidifex tepidarius]